MLTKDQLNKLTLNLNRGRYETVIIESRRLLNSTQMLRVFMRFWDSPIHKAAIQKRREIFPARLKIMPSLGSARFNLAKVYFETGKITQAISTLRKLTSSDYQTELVPPAGNCFVSEWELHSGSKRVQ